MGLLDAGVCTRVEEYLGFLLLLSLAFLLILIWLIDWVGTGIEGLVSGFGFRAWIWGFFGLYF